MALRVMRCGTFSSMACICRCLSSATAETNPSPKPSHRNTMSAWQLHKYGGTEELTLSNTVRIPILHSPNDMLIEVHAASINPIDVRMRGGYGRVVFNMMRKGLSSLPFLQPDVPLEFPLTLGRDFSGVVVSAGKKVKKFKPGDEVWGALSVNRQGSHAEFVVASELEISKKPKNLTFVEAGSIPYVAVTTWTALCSVGEVTEKNANGKRVLIFAGSGGIGQFAIQLMKAWGAEVTTTCSTDAVELCQSLGADVVVDYKTMDEDGELSRLSGFDIILDTIGTKSLSVSLDLLKRWGNSKYVTIVPPVMKNADDIGLVLGTAKSVGTLACNVMEGFRGGRSYRWALFMPNAKALRVVTEMVETGQVIPVVEHVFPFGQVPEAFNRLEQGHARGKTVIDTKREE